jgi:flavin-dependent dehydrogenase
MRIAIIGSSIAGASAALLLAGKADVVVYEKKERNDIGKKTCLNNVTESFLEHAKRLGLKPTKYVKSISNKAIVKSDKNEIKFKTKEYKLDRQKLLDDLIKKAKKKGAKFYFGVDFVSLGKMNKFRLTLRKGKMQINDYADILIGADGALSRVAKESGEWNKRKLYIILQKEVSSRNFKLKLEKNTYYVYVGKKYGYFSYIYQSKNTAVLGLAGDIETAKSKFRKFLKELKINDKSLSAALVPEPKIIAQKNNLFLIGDAGCNTKFSGGGIVPAIRSAFSAKEAIFNKNYKGFNELNSKIRLNKMILNVVKNLKDKDFDYLLKVAKDRKFSNVLEKRDELSKKDILNLADFRLLRFLPKLL